MKNKVLLIILVVFLLGGAFGLGYYLNSDDKCDDQNEKNTNLIEHNENFNAYNFGGAGNGYFYISGLISDDNYEDLIMYIYNEKLELVKTYKNASYINRVDFGGNVAYQVTIELGRGGANATTYVLNKDLDVIVKTSMLPEKYDTMDSELFTPYFNSNGTISIMINDIYFYDYEGNLINTIENKDGNIKGIAEDYYAINENGKLNLVNVATGDKTLIIDKENADIMHSPTNGSPLIEWKENGNLFVDIMEGEDFETGICYTYEYKRSNDTLIQVSKEKRECY